MSEADLFAQMLERTRRFLTDDDLRKIQAQTVALAGLGGVGAIVPELLVRFGVTKFRLMDKDRYEPSNLNRQLYATRSTMDRWKVEVAAERMTEINPSAHCEALITEKASRQNVETLVSGADLLLVETDMPSSKFIFREAAHRHRIPLINGHCEAVVGGSVHVFDYRDAGQREGIWYSRSAALNGIARKLLGKKDPDQVSDEELEVMDTNIEPTGSLAFVTNLIGCLVVAETIKLITGRGRRCVHPRLIKVNVFESTMGISTTRTPGKWLEMLLRLIKR